MLSHPPPDLVGRTARTQRQREGDQAEEQAAHRARLQPLVSEVDDERIGEEEDGLEDSHGDAPRGTRGAMGASDGGIHGRAG